MVTVGLSVTAAMAVIVESQHVKSTFTLEIKVKTRECTQQSFSCSVEAAACCAALRLAVLCKIVFDISDVYLLFLYTVCIHMCACLSASLCMCNDCEHTAPQRRIRVLGREMSRIQRQKGKRQEERWMKATGHEAGG